jgi:hypothetical protein
VLFSTVYTGESINEPGVGTDERVAAAALFFIAKQNCILNQKHS